MTRPIIIGCPSGYWGDAPLAMEQLLAVPALDYLVFDYLAEITMSILARARASDPNAGYATDFVGAVVPHLGTVARRGIKLISNAGGLNPAACASAIREQVRAAGLDLRVAAITGDDLIERRDLIAARSPRDMFTDAAFPPVETIGSINAYLGAFPIAQALAAGADIVVTGRCVDSAVTLAACIHAFGWSADDLDHLAGGSLAGHILECGPHATGGNFTDWRSVPALDRIGYPIAIVEAGGAFTVTKPDNTGGLVSVGSVAEQMVYEIGDPQAYLLPDVTCDFSAVTLTPDGPDRVRVDGAIGRPATDSYKVCATYRDGFRGGSIVGFYGADAEDAARRFADGVTARTATALADAGDAPLGAVSIELLGAESHYGAARRTAPAREVALKIAAKHPSKAGVTRFLRELSGFGLATPPGLTGFAATRPKPSPVVRLFSFLVAKTEIAAVIDLEGTVVEAASGPPGRSLDPPTRPVPPPVPDLAEAIAVPLVKLAWGRSGDKGDNVNIGIVARRPELLPFIWAALTPEIVRERFAHFLTGEVERFLMPGSSAINFLLHGALDGGGTASLRMDPQGKGFAQLLLELPIPVSPSVARSL